jgi:poly-beta-hydroxyalkanoate depolymerase
LLHFKKENSPEQPRLLLVAPMSGHFATLLRGAYRKVHHMRAGVGHYGVFSGRRWNNEIYPLLRDFVHVNS